MTETNRDTIDHDPDAQIVHAVNSQLIEIFFGEDGHLRDLLVDRASWIINVLYVHGVADSNPVLRTSSTLHSGRLYDHRSTRDGDVLSIDETVPLATSVCGRCVLSGRPIWLDKAEMGRREQGFGERFYRRFSLVDVDTAGYKIPRAEIVFPIADQHLNVTATLGVLNLELFGDVPLDSDRYIELLPRESVNELLSHILHIHAAFLRVAVNMFDLQVTRGSRLSYGETRAENMPSGIETILDLHRATFDLFVARKAKLIEDLVAALRGSDEESLRFSQGEIDGD